MIVWLASYPRSGNTYFRVLLKQHYGIKTNTIHEIRREAPSSVLKELGLTDNVIPTLGQVLKDDHYHIVKTHELPTDDFAAIYLVRDGRDALVSHAHYHLEFDLKLPANEQPARFNQTLRMLTETDISYGGWSGNVQAWTTRRAPTAVIRYEDLIRQPKETMQTALKEIDYPLPTLIAQESASFEALNQLQPRFFRKGRTGAWREEMPPELHRLFWQRHGEAMTALGYQRQASLLDTLRTKLGSGRRG